jgi:hypothetical protein
VAVMTSCEIELIINRDDQLAIAFHDHSA